MTQYKFVAAAAVAALTFGITEPKLAPADPPPLSQSDIVIAAGDTAPDATESDENAEDSAKMDKEQGAHMGDDGDAAESETKKVEQPDTGNAGDSD